MSKFTRSLSDPWLQSSDLTKKIKEVGEFFENELRLTEKTYATALEYLIYCEDHLPYYFSPWFSKIPSRTKADFGFGTFNGIEFFTRKKGKEYNKELSLKINYCGKCHAKIMATDWKIDARFSETRRNLSLKSVFKLVDEFLQ